jgi:membrane protein DedA with SNARE-associated domain
MSRRRRLALLLVPIGAFLVLANTGSVLAPSWAHHHPALLLSFDSRNRHLLLTVGGGIAPAAFFLIGFVRLLITDPLFYLLGRWYGDTAIRWFERTTGGANGTAAFISRVFAKAGDVLVLIMPNNIVSLLAGHTRMDWRRFAVLDIVGTIGRLILMWFLGRAFRKPLETVVDWLQRFQWPLIGAFAVIAILNGLRSARAAVPVVEELERVAVEEDDQAEA